jgi:hypothetical protein
MLPDCAAPSPEESGMFDFMFDARTFFRSVSVRYWMRNSAIMPLGIDGDNDDGGRQLPTSKVLRRETVHRLDNFRVKLRVRRSQTAFFFFLTTPAGAN